MIWRKFCFDVDGASDNVQYDMWSDKGAYSFNYDKAE
jgi:hypothetical protein